MSASFGDVVMVDNLRDFTDDEKTTARTVFCFDLPFLLQRMQGEYIVPFRGESVTAHITPRQVAKEAAERTLGMKIEAPGITALGDYGGRLNVSRVTLVFGKFVQLRPRPVETGPGKFRDDPPRSDLNAQNEQLMCEVTNVVIDADALKARCFFTRPLVPDDLFAWAAHHQLGEGSAPAKFNRLRIPFRGQASLTPPHLYPWQPLQTEELTSVLDEDGGVPLFRAMLLSARRAQHQGNLRPAVIEACTAIDNVLTTLTRSRMVGKGISPRHLDDCKRDIGLSLTIKVLFRLVRRDDDQVDDQHLQAADRIRKLRNDLIHEPSPPPLDPAEVGRLLDDAEKLCERVWSLR